MTVKQSRQTLYVKDSAGRFIPTHLLPKSDDSRRLTAYNAGYDSQSMEVLRFTAGRRLTSAENRAYQSGAAVAADANLLGTIDHVYFFMNEKPTERAKSDSFKGRSNSRTASIAEIPGVRGEEALAVLGGRD